jgi:DNA-binding MarR family transcriptional regulator
MQMNMIIYRVYHAQKNWVRPKMARIDLSPGQPKVLSHVYAHNHCMQKEIAEALDIEPATVSKILNNMVEAGLVERSPLEQRRRAESVSITPKGKRYYEKWNALCGDYEKLALQGFSEQEKAQLADFLHRMYQNVKGKALE